MCGLSSKAIQNSLLKKKELTLAKAVELATSMEAAAKEVTELQATATADAATADAATAGATKRDVLKVTVNCYRCGKSNHKPTNCPVKGLRCHNCGHIKRACRQAKRNFNAHSSDRKRTHRVETVLEVTDTDAESEEDVQYLNYVAAKPTGPIPLEGGSAPRL